MKERWYPVSNTQLPYMRIQKCAFCGAIVLVDDAARHWESHELIINAVIILLQTAGIDGMTHRRSKGFDELLSWVT